MFKLLRLFPLFSLAVAALAALAHSYYSYHTVQQTVIAHAEEQNRQFAEMLAPQVETPLRQLAQGDADPQLKTTLANILMNQREGRQLAALAFYDAEGELLFADTSTAPGVLSALQLARLQRHHVLSELYSPAAEIPRYHVISLVPLTDGRGELRFTVSVDLDISALYRRTDQSRWRITLFGVGVLALLYLLLFGGVRYAERQLRTQHRQLEASLHELRLSRHELERRVEHRTRTLAQEVEERRIAERRLREQEAYLHAIMDNVFNAIISIDECGTIRAFNRTAEKMFGYDQTQALGKNITRMIPEGVHGDADARGVARPLVGSLLELRAQHSDGTPFTVEVALTESSLGNRTIFICTIRDLTTQKASELELDEARQKYYHQEKMAAIGSLAAGLVHEIGNPTAAVSGLLDSLCDEQGCCSEEVEEQLELVKEQVQRIIQITRDVSEFSNPQGQAAQLLDLNNLIGRTCRLMKHDQRFREIQLKLELDDQIPAVTAIADYLIQILMNLLVNALDAIVATGRQDGLVKVLSGTSMGRECFAVEDNGTGMSPEVLMQAREAFYTTKGAGQGTGLGLSLCDSLVAAHQGELTIDSEWGLGTRVRVVLPLENV